MLSQAKDVSNILRLAASRRGVPKMAVAEGLSEAVGLSKTRSMLMNALLNLSSGSKGKISLYPCVSDHMRWVGSTSERKGAREQAQERRRSSL